MERVKELLQCALKHGHLSEAFGSSTTFMYTGWYASNGTVSQNEDARKLRMHRSLVHHTDVIKVTGLTDISSVFNTSKPYPPAMRGRENGKKQTGWASIMRATVAIDDQGRERKPLFHCIVMSRSGTTAGNAVAVVINDNIGQKFRGKRQTRDGPFTRAMNNICQNPLLWLYFYMKCNLQFLPSTIDSAFKGMEPGITLSAGLCNYDEITGALILPNHINAMDQVVDKTITLFRTVRLGDDDMYGDYETTSEQYKSLSKSRGFGEHSDANKDSTGSNKTQSSISGRDKEKNDVSGLSNLIVNKENVDKKDQEEQTAGKLRGLSSWKTTESVEKERIEERRTN